MKVYVDLDPRGYRWRDKYERLSGKNFSPSNLRGILKSNYSWKNKQYLLIATMCHTLFQKLRFERRKFGYILN